MLPVVRVTVAWTWGDKVMATAAARASMACQWAGETMALKSVALRTWAATAEELEAAILILIKSLTVEEDLISGAIATANLMLGQEVMEPES